MFRSAHTHIMRAAKECCRRTFSARLLTFTASVSIIFWNEPIKRMKTTANAVVFSSFEERDERSNAAIPRRCFLESAPSPQRRRAKQCRAPSTHHPSKGGERSNAAAAQAVRRRANVTRAPRSRARLIPVTICRRLVAQPRTPHLHCAARAVLQAQNLQCKPFSGG